MKQGRLISQLTFSFGLLSLCLPLSSAQTPLTISNPRVAVSTLMADDNAYGFAFSADAGKITDIELCNGTRWVAKQVKHDSNENEQWIELSDIDTSGTGNTPSLEQDSFVRVTLRRNGAFPRIDFRLRIQSFDPER